jgi:hypothetical protein
MNISILIPTRHRPHNVLRLVESIIKTSSGINGLELLFFVDLDDKETWDLLPLLEDKMKRLIYSAKGYIKFISSADDPKIHYNRWWNFLWKHASGDIFMQGGDDLVFSTEGWDKAVVKAFESYPDRMSVVYCNDGSCDSHIRATHPFLSREWCNLLGYFQPTIFDGAYNDTWITELGKLTGRLVHLDNYLIDHMHVDFGKSSNDEVYDRQRQACREQDSRKIFQDTLPVRQKDAQKILDYINQFKTL